MKSITIFMVLCSVIILSGCSSEKDRTIEYQNNRIDELESIIEDCNSGIEDAQYYLGGDYDEMEYALSNLKTCDSY